MGFLDKVKNMFLEDVEDDEPIKKEEIQVKIEAPVKEETPLDEIEEEIKEEKEEPIIEKEITIIKSENLKPTLPTFFDDNDFEEVETPVIKEEKEITKIEYGTKKESKYGTKKEEIVTPTITGYNGKKEELKKLYFEPTPIISPVYGVLDKNYKKDEITSKKQETKVVKQKEHKNVNLDDIRKKAFGSLEDELETTLESKEHLMFTAPPEKIEEEPIDIFAELESEENTLDDLLNSYTFDEDQNLDNKLSRNYDLYEEDEIELNDSDLFNLIDSMYEKRDDK